MVLTIEEAGDRYLDIVCPSNAAVNALTAAFTATEGSFLNGEAADLAPVKAAAQVRMESTSVEIDLIEDESVIWPEEVTAHLTTLRDYSVAELATISSIVNAADYEEAYYAAWPDGTNVAPAAQEIRRALELSPDTAASCVGHEDGHGRLLAAQG
ncbi:hypothetical protein ACDF64_03185 [Agromyces sp. MMS24-JH15]|uniref:hypothetical protein n=1 Tax=Agromyces sp. MMS24-JH15 TaxID=3243765 RepID=UPI003748B042